MVLTYRWLGVAGLEFTFEDYTLLIDPFFTRPGKAAVLANRRVRSNEALIEQHIGQADAVLVTHPHYDHLLDVPGVMRRTGAHAYGSQNTCALLALHGISSNQVHQIQFDDLIQLGPFTVRVFPNEHTRIPFSNLFNGALPHYLLNGSTHLPLRLRDYRMDACYGFNIQVNGLTIQIGKHPLSADLLFISPYSGVANSIGVANGIGVANSVGEGSLETILRVVQPRCVVPIHWDDFMHPLSHPLQPMLLTPAQGLKKNWPPVRRLDLEDFACAVRRTLPEAEVRVPKIFELVPVR